MGRNGTNPGIPVYTEADATARLKKARKKPTTMQQVVGLAGKWKKYGPALVIVAGVLLSAWRYVAGIREDVQWIRKKLEQTERE
jgi:hypothetical protein